MRALFIGGHAQWQELESECARMPGVEHILQCNQDSGYGSQTVSSGTFQHRPIASIR